MEIPISAHLRFINMPGKGPRSKKRRREEQGSQDSQDLEGSDNPSFEDSMVSSAPEQSISESDTPPVPPPRYSKSV